MRLINNIRGFDANGFVAGFAASSISLLFLSVALSMAG